ncbi:MAG: amidase family protein, partial [Pseudomonadales bacterium]
MTHDLNSTRARSSRASDPCFWSATQMHAAFRAKRFSPAEAVDACAGQIDQLEGTLAAFLAVDLDHARDAAALIDVSAEPAKNLAGIPYSLKDNIDVKNWRTTCHSSARRDVVADKDSDVASALRDA